MAIHTGNRKMDANDDWYDEWEDFWCSLVITDEELASVDLDDYELDLENWLFIETDD